VGPPPDALTRAAYLRHQSNQERALRTDIEPPSNLGDKDLVRFFPGCKWLQSPIGPINLDFRTVNFIAPWAICLFAALVTAVEGPAVELRKREEVAKENAPFTASRGGRCTVLIPFAGCADREHARLRSQSMARPLMADN